MPGPDAAEASGTRLPHLGTQLRRLRVLRGMKQGHVAELAGVAQTTVSRWESGAVRSDDEVKRLIERLRAPSASAAERALRWLVEMAAAPVHLIDDESHRLLAASPAREREWGVAATDLMGTSLWRYATDDIRAAETRWRGRGPSLEVMTTAGTHPELRIAAGTMIWERLELADGSVGRLCTSVDRRA